MSKILIAVTIVTAVLSVPVVATAGNLTEADKAHLIFMRSEEKLARDVYLTLAVMYPNQPVFLSIATTAEQTHTDKMLDMLIKFKIEDPEPSTLPDTLPPDEDQIGVFENYYFAYYFGYKFDGLIDTASAGELEALYVGALIEELDMSDINYCNNAFYEYYPKPLPEYPDCGGLSATEIRSLKNSLNSLLAGSENHLCAFISQIGPIMVEECYEAQYLGQQEVWDIVSAQCPEFSGYVCDPEQP